MTAIYSRILRFLAGNKKKSTSGHTNDGNEEIEEEFLSVDSLIMDAKQGHVLRGKRMERKWKKIEH